MTVEELIEELQKHREDAIVRCFYIDEYGENYPEITEANKFSIGEFSDPYEDYDYLKGSIILK